MREMKDSGVEWVGQIPKDWEKTKIKTVCSFVGSGTTPASNIIEYYDNGTIDWIQSGDIYGKNNIDEVKTKITTLALNSNTSLRIYKAPFIVMAMYGGSVGNTAISHIDACTNQACCCIKTNENANLSYMYYWLLLCKEDFLIRAEGGGQPNISQDKIKNQYFFVSNYAEQKKIADCLDEKCSEIDVLTSDIQKQIDTLEQYKKSVITEAVTKGLNPDAEMKDSGVKWLKQIPSSWSVMPNKYLMHKIKEICPVYKDEDILSLTMKGVVIRDLDAGGKMPTSFDGYQRLHKGNLLMCLFDIDVTPRCIGLINDEGLSSPAYSQFVLENIADSRYFTYYYTMLDNDKTLLHLAKNLRHSLTEDLLGEVPTAVPPIDEQKKIADFLDKKCSEIDTIISDKKKQLEVITEYKKSLIYEYVTGKKEVM